VNCYSGLQISRCVEFVPSKIAERFSHLQLNIFTATLSSSQSPNEVYLSQDFGFSVNIYFIPVRVTFLIKKCAFIYPQDESSMFCSCLSCNTKCVNAYKF
jgi:hypothetical protein